MAFSSRAGAWRALQCFGVLYPELEERDVVDKLMVGKKLFIEMTGSVTRYRQQWIERINRQLTSLGLQNVFGYCVSLPFAVLASEEAGRQGRLFPSSASDADLAVLQARRRIFRALSVDHNLPILTRHFHQNPIEDVCFVLENRMSIVELYEMYADPLRLRKFYRAESEVVQRTRCRA